MALVCIYGIGAAFFAGIFYFFVPAILDDLGRIARILPKYIDVSGLWNPLSGGNVAEVSSRAVGSASGTLGQGLLEGGSFVDILKKSLEQTGAIQSLSAFFGGFFSFVLIVVLHFIWRRKSAVSKISFACSHQ